MGEQVESRDSHGFRAFGFQILPIVPRETASEFAKKSLALTEQVENSRKLEDAINASNSEDILREIRDIASGWVDNEEKRHASVTARAKALLVGDRKSVV